MWVVLVAAAVAEQHNVMKPAADVNTAALYASSKVVKHTGNKNHNWESAKQPALDALNTLGRYLTFDDGDLPPLFYADTLNDNIVGYYAFAGNESINITLLDTLTDENEFFVALHELLHWAGFGNIHDVPNTQEVYSNWRREFDSDLDPAIGQHWDTAPGTHRRLGRPGSSEIMTAKLTGNIFLSATTVTACTRNLVTVGNVCIDNSDCADNTCHYSDGDLPGTCTEELGHYHRQSDDNVVLAVLLPVLFIAFAVGITRIE